MKKLITLSAIALLAANIIAQPPQLMSYQSVVRTASGELITKQSIGVRTTILRGSIIQIIVYQETYSPNPSTNENGLLTLAIGSGTPSTGDFSKIDWSNGPYFLRTEMDPKGGTNYTIAGSSQILSVPYSLYAEKTGSETDPVWTGASGNYYTKTNLQTSGQAAVHWNNLTNMDADVEDLASDGILTGSKVGTGISADNITTGTLPLARLSGITTNQLSAAAGIVTGQITSLVSSKLTGISANRVPRSNGTGLVTGTIFDNGTNVGVGESFIPEALLHIRNSPSKQLMIGNINQPNKEWYFTADPSAGFSLNNENLGTPFTGLHFIHRGPECWVGIGTSDPKTKLDINGQIKISGGTPAAGQVLTSDAAGLATWEPVPVPTVNQIYFEVKRDASYNWPINSTNQKVDFSSGSSVWENQGNAFNQTTSTFTAPEDGIYSFRGAIMFRNIASGSLIYAFLTAGNMHYYSNYKYSGGASEMVDVSITLFLSKNQTAYLGGYVDDPTPPAEVYGNTAADYTFTFFSGAKVH